MLDLEQNGGLPQSSSSKSLGTESKLSKHFQRGLERLSALLVFFTATFNIFKYGQYFSTLLVDCLLNVSVLDRRNHIWIQVLIIYSAHIISQIKALRLGAKFYTLIFFEGASISNYQLFVGIRIEVTSIVGLPSSSARFYCRVKLHRLFALINNIFNC